MRPEYGKSSLEYIDVALKILRDAKAQALVTSPVSKEAISLSGLRDFQGHTEYLASRTNSKNFAMMVLSPDLKIVLSSRHIPLCRVSSYLTRSRLYQTISLTHWGLRRFFKIKSPRIAVAALNPHCGEAGWIGFEEARIIKPAVSRAKKEISRFIDGPVSADSVFYKTLRGKYDCVVAMYHDQALIPLKITSFEKIVNFTLGLPFVRTCPGHGTGFEISGKGKASSSSMSWAIELAAKFLHAEQKPTKEDLFGV
jgi:4-hydroxythreonine-4-phosphate dehydrogenase